MTVAAPARDGFDDNCALIEREIADGVVDVDSVPHEIQFGVEHRCNLRCIMCVSTAVRKAGRVPIMDRDLPANILDLFQKLVVCWPAWRKVNFTGTGEPLLSPALPRLLEVMRRHGVATSFTTNGILLTRERAEMIVAGGLDEVTFSVDAACRETYEKIRLGGRWERFIAGVDTLNRVKREMGSGLPRVKFAGNFMRMNIEELPGLVDFAADHGGAAVWATKTVIYDAGLQDQDLSHHPEISRRMVTEAIRRAGERDIVFHNWIVEPEAEPAAPPAQTRHLVSALRNAVSRARRIGARLHRFRPRRSRPVVQALRPGADIIRHCRLPWTGLTVWSDGRAQVCCGDSPVLGNLNRVSFEELRNGGPARALRRAFLEGRPPASCLACPVYAGNFGDRVPAPTTRMKLDFPGEEEVIRDRAAIFGWAADPAGIRRIEVLLDGRPAGEADYGHVRADVPAAHPELADSGHSGFYYIFDTTGVADGFHLLTFRITNGAGDCSDVGFRTVFVDNNGAAPHQAGTADRSGLERLFTLDYPREGDTLVGEETIFGWALDPGGARRFDILLDGRKIGETACDAVRWDVAMAHPEYDDRLLSGFAFPLDTAALSEGSHVLAVRTAGASAERVVAQRTIHLSRQ